MTKEEAIVCLKGIKDYGRDTFTEQSDWQNSLDMAIKALKQQPSDDVSFSLSNIKDIIAKLEAKCYPKYGRDSIYAEAIYDFAYEIKALSPVTPKIPTSDDCVSREKVWYMITGGKYPNEDYEQFIDRLVKELENMPPVTPTQRWIPVSERLPTENERVLVNQTIDNRNVVYCTRFPFEKTKVEYITAWQPLPKPYEEKRGNENDTKTSHNGI